MEGRTRLWSIILSAALCLAAGCGKDDTSPAGGGATSDGGSGTTGTVGLSKKRRTGDTADVAVETVLEGLKENRLDAFWDFLPASYQKDLNDLVHSFAGRMDAELWNKSVAVLRKFARLLKDKTEFLAAARARQAPEADLGPFKAELVAIADLLETLLASDLADLEKLKTADGGKFLAGTGRKLLAQLRATGHDPFADRLGLFSDMKVTLDSTEGDSALLTFEVPSATAAEREFVRVEGKWVPKDLADDWHHHIGQANAQLSLLSPDNLQENKPQYLALLSALDAALERLAAARTEQQFTAAMGAAEETLKPFVPLVASLAGPSPEEEPADGDDAAVEAGELVTVIVKASLTDDAQDALRERLNAVTDDPARAVGEITGDDETTTIRVGPVKDVGAFAERLDFLKITNVDARTRVVTAVPKK